MNTVRAKLTISTRGRIMVHSEAVPAEDTRVLAAGVAFGRKNGWWLSQRDDGFWELQKFDDDPQKRFISDLSAYTHAASQTDEASKQAVRLDGTRWRS